MVPGDKWSRRRATRPKTLCCECDMLRVRRGTPDEGFRDNSLSADHNNASTLCPESWTRSKSWIWIDGIQIHRETKWRRSRPNPTTSRKLFTIRVSHDVGDAVQHRRRYDGASVKHPRQTASRHEICREKGQTTSQSALAPATKVPAPPMTVVPSSSQIETAPLLCWNRMSEFPSPL